MASENVLATQATIGLIGSWVLQQLKKSSISFVNEHSAVINHVILLITSAAGALSVGFVWNSTSHSLTITGLDAMAIATSLWLWGKQWTVQFLIHRGVFGVVSKPAAPPMTQTMVAGGPPIAGPLSNVRN